MHKNPDRYFYDPNPEKWFEIEQDVVEVIMKIYK